MRPDRALLSRALAVVAVVLAVALPGCGGRDHANPFDPANQATAGRPVGFEALAGDGRVDLRWQAISYAGLAGYQLERRTALETDYHPISGLLAPATSQYIDRGLLNGLEHSYRLYYVIGSATSGSPAEDAAIPGHAQPWVADAQSGLLERITPDGRRVAEARGGLLAPVAVGCDSLSGRVWCSDAAGGEVVVRDPWTGATIQVPVGQSPGEIAVVPGDSSVWVCDEGGGEVIHLDTEGRRIGAIGPLATPTSVAVSPRDGSLWICEHDGNRVLHLDTDLGTLSATSLTRPSRVAIDPRDGTAWVSLFTSRQVVKLSPSGAVAFSLGGLGGPVGIAIDERRDRVWIADTGGNEVIALRGDGSVAVTVAAMPGARALAVDHESGEVWVALATSGEVVRLSSSGAVLWRLGGFKSPYGIGVIP